MTLNKLPPRYAQFVMPLILSVLMTCVVSAISILRSRGVNDSFSDYWFPAWGLSWIVAFPVLLAILPLVRRLTNMVVQPQR